MLQLTFALPFKSLDSDTSSGKFEAVFLMHFVTMGVNNKVL